MRFPFLETVKLLCGPDAIIKDTHIRDKVSMDMSSV